MMRFSLFCCCCLLLHMVQCLATESFQEDHLDHLNTDDNVLAHLRFEMSRERTEWNFRWQVVLTASNNQFVDDQATIESSLTSIMSSQGKHSHVFLFELFLKVGKDYLFIVECHEVGDEDSQLSHKRLPVLAIITLSCDNQVFLSQENLHLDSERAFAIPFKIEQTTGANEARRLLDTSPTYIPKLYIDPPKRPPTPDLERPPTVKPSPPTPRPPISPPVSQPSTIAPAVGTPSPAIQTQPSFSPNQGNSPSPQTAAPTTYDQLKPPSIYTANVTNTSAPSISFAPSASPTVEPPCLSSTIGFIQFDNKYIAVKLDLLENYIQSTDLSQNDTSTILADIVDAYNAVARCDQKGAFRRIEQAFLQRVSDSSDSAVEWIVRLTGTCQGCIDSAQSLFSDFLNPSAWTDLPWLNLTDADTNGTALGGKPCFCPGPWISTFQERFRQILQVTSMDSKLQLSSVVELENDNSCDTTLLQEDFARQQFSTLIMLVVTRDPSGMTNEELHLIYDQLIQVVDAHLSLTYPTCDLSRKRIVDVQRDSTNPTLARDLRNSHPLGDNIRRKVQETSADFELVLNVTFTCFGCEGRLFGKTKFIPNIDCLCPKDGDRFGVNEQDIISPLNDAITLLSISDIIEIAHVPCSSIVNDFSTMVVIEYMLKSNETNPTPDDLALLENEFVLGYNGMARRYCDPYFRRIISADTLSNATSKDGLKLNVEMSVIGTCRGNCTSYISIYDPDAFFKNMSIVEVGDVANPSRSIHVDRRLRLHVEADGTCYCSSAATKDLGPSEPEIIQNFGELVRDLSLENILQVAECRPLSFKGAFQLNVTTNGTKLTQAELDQIGQRVKESYNNLARQNGFCDEFFREIITVEVSLNSTIGKGFKARALGEDQTKIGRKLLTRTSFSPKHRVQAQGSETSWSPSTAPSLTPTIDWKSSTSAAPYIGLPISPSKSPVLIELIGRCQGCPSDIDFFDQAMTRRHLSANDSGSEVDGNTTDTRRCFCAPNLPRVKLSSEQVVQAVSTLPFVNGTVDLAEVEILDCSVEVNTFTTTTPLDFLVNGEIVAGDEDYIGAGFMKTYLELSEEYCDSLFRRPEEVVSTSPFVLSGPDQNGVSKIRFLIELQGTCRGCTGSESLFDSKRRRMQGEEEVCYCKKNAVQGAPTDEEFQREFSKNLGSGRRLEQLSKFTLLCVGATCDPIVPTLSPTTVSLVNPGGVQNYPGCDVAALVFVGDGYCDRALDGNGQPIYNSANCGYDGGDCCESTCQDFAFACGSGGYWCLDPNAQDTTTSAPVALTCADQAGVLVGDGFCNAELNIPFCNYDEGDCCESTCGVLNGLTCLGPFQSCVDPTALENTPSSTPTFALSHAPSRSPSGVPTATPSNVPSLLPSSAPTTVLIEKCASCGSSDFCGDGFCDHDLNNDNCGWDGGDCCKESCVSRVFDCPSRDLDYVCRDPEYNGLPATCIVTNPEFVGDGFCDVHGGYNNANCNFDGGDCCNDSCVKGKYQCTFFACARGLGLPIECEVPEPSWIGDGYCDYVDPYNTKNCNWDNGDCCQETCVSKKYTCGFDSAYFCRDPKSNFFTNLTLPPPLPAGCNVTHVAYLGDGACFGGSEYNTAECDWDFGDCCHETCTTNEALWHHPYLCGSYGYDCLDPAIPRKNATPSNCTVPQQSWLGDGWCSGGEYNTAECLWEFGDCCNRTCNEAPWYKPYECGVAGYDCKDPGEPKPPQVNDACKVDNKKGLGDGWCNNGIYNTRECGWDFGDCCARTCKNATWYKKYKCGSGGYNCSDPEVPKPPSLPNGCRVISKSRLGDGACDYGSYNTPECLYDFGDCCEQSCKEAPWDHKYECGSFGYYCLNATVKAPRLFNCTVSPRSALGDGKCDSGAHNTAECGWDLGDCCLTTCGEQRWFKVYKCGAEGFNCSDPSQTELPPRPSVPPGCNVSNVHWLGDGWCHGDDEYNTAACLWDLGDCCNKTCAENLLQWPHPYECGINGYECKDPAVPQPPPYNPTTCSPDNPEKLGDGRCDSESRFNNGFCSYDFGDCCFKTCTEAHIAGYHQYECGSNGYSCLDQSVPKPPPIPKGCNVSDSSLLGDGACNYGAYNTAACNWDFGDCCYQTCTNTIWYHPFECGSYGYDCLDPEGGPPSDIKLVGFYTDLFDYDEYLSGTYTAKSDFLFGQPVYYRYIGSLMVHWCQEGHWTIQIIANITLIASKGCQGQGFRSLQQTSPNLCGAVWEDDFNSTVVVACSVNCPQPCPPESLTNAAQTLSLSPTSIPTSYSSKHQSMLSIFPSNIPSRTPTFSKLPSIMPSNPPSLVPSKSSSATPSTLSTMFLSKMPSTAPSKLPSMIPSTMPSPAPANEA